MASYKSIKQAVEAELGASIAYKIGKVINELERRHGHIHLTALDNKAYQRHVKGLIKVLLRAMTREQLFP